MSKGGRPIGLRVFGVAVLALLILGVSLVPVTPAQASHVTDTENSTCQCSARLSFSRPELNFNASVLTFIPRVDISLRTRGSADAPDWSLGLNYTGQANFASEDVSAPGPLAFNGQQHVVGGQCGNNRYTFKGLALSPVTFTNIPWAIVGPKQELDGQVNLQAALQGCSQETKHSQFSFRLKEVGNLLVRSWRTVR